MVEKGLSNASQPLKVPSSTLDKGIYTHTYTYTTGVIHIYIQSLPFLHNLSPLMNESDSNTPSTFENFLPMALQRKKSPRAEKRRKECYPDSSMRRCFDWAKVCS